jgi:hypothetical protein
MSQNTSKTSSDFVQEFYERIWNAGDLQAADELLAGEFAFRGSLGPEMRGAGLSVSTSVLLEPLSIVTAATFWIVSRRATSALPR